MKSLRNYIHFCTTIRMC